MSAQYDSGDVAVIEDDGTIIAEVLPFNLNSVSLRFEPATSSSYLVTATASTYSSAGITPILPAMGDDDSHLLSIGFPFTFYGATYTSLYVNSDGNITFNQGDAAHTDRSLGRFSSDLPRIGPFFADLNPAQGGSVSYRNDSDGLLIAWDSVPEYSETSPVLINTFSAKLFKDGKIEFVYGTRVDSLSAVIGISPGNSSGGISSISYSSGLPAGPLSGTIAEVFSSKMSVSEAAVAKKFFETHPDSFDHLNLFLGFSYDLGNSAFAYELPIKNEVQGIGLKISDDTSYYASNGRLRSFLNMGTLSGRVNGISRYPDDPNQLVLGTNTTMGIMGQESGHRWLAFTPFRDGITNSSAILGRDLAHWSFFYNSEGSVMEGNDIQDRGASAGNQRFITTDADTSRYSHLDQYVIGLLAKEDVPPSFLVENPVGASFYQPSSSPRIGVVFGGSRKDVTIDSIIASNGSRVPSVAQSPKVFRQGFIYLVKKGQAVDPSQVAKVQRIRDAWVSFFHSATDSRGWIVTNLQNTPAATASTINFPYFQGTNRRYNGIAVANWGEAPADILFQAYDNGGAGLSSPATIINPRMITIPPGAQIALLAEQIHGISLDDNRNGWIQAQSTSSKITGFFLDGDLTQTQLSGATAGDQTATTIYFTRAQLATQPSPTSSYRNLIDVVNPNTASANVVLEFYDESGILSDTARRTLPGHGRLAEDLPALFSTVTAPRSTGYVKVTSNVGIVGYQSIDSGLTFFGLPGLSDTSASTLYSAQFASGGSGSVKYLSDLVIINTTGQFRQVTIQLVGNDGKPVPGIVGPETRTLSPQQQIRISGESLFGLPKASSSTSLVEGSLVITADGPGIIGDLTFGDPVGGKFLAGLPLNGNPVSNFVFSQVAEGDNGNAKPYFTGIAMYNPGATDTQVTIDVYSRNGIKTGSASIPLPKGNRLSQTLPQYLPALSQQIGGYLKINSGTQPIIAFELFGTQSLDFLAAVPPQPITP